MELIKELKAKTEARIEENLEAKSWTWLATGGSPLFTFFPSSIKDIQTFLKIKEKNMLFRTFGAASNILIRDNKFNGVFIRLMKGFRSFEVENDKIIVSAGLPSSLIVNQAIKANLGNIEFLATIPGMLGGMIKMNAGAHEQEIGEAIEWVEFLDETGALNRINNKECLFTYRNSIFKPNWIILKACIKCKKQDQEKSLKKLRELTEHRKNTQPNSGKMAGCFFKNPSEQKAWELIRKCSIKSQENVTISEIHANFIMNTKNASSFEIENFAKTIQANVFFNKNIKLESEIEIIGN